MRQMFFEFLYNANIRTFDKSKKSTNNKID